MKRSGQNIINYRQILFVPLLQSLVDQHAVNGKILILVKNGGELIASPRSSEHRILKESARNAVEASFSQKSNVR